MTSILFHTTAAPSSLCVYTAQSVALDMFEATRET